MIASLLAGCSRPAAESAAPRGPATVPVTAVAAESRDVPIRLAAIGTADPVSTVSIRPQVGGLLASAAFQEGQEVRQGDLLFRIDDRPFVTALHQAQAALARDQAQEIAATRDAARYDELLLKNFVSAEDRDRLVAQRDSAKAAVVQDKATIEAARLQVAYATIRSPIDGKTGPLLIQPGNVVQANASVLVTIHQMRPIRVAFPVPESRLPDLRQRMAAGVLDVLASPQGDPGPAIAGRLTFLGNEVDRATGTVLLKATFENGDGRLWPGQFVRVSLTLGVQKGATVVPSAAVQDGQQGSYVFVVKPDDTADLRKVTLGPADDGFTVVDGVAPGEQVVTDGQLRLAPGTRVERRR
jgi:multidrug efflux system membrane fusion protein